MKDLEKINRPLVGPYYDADTAKTANSGATCAEKGWLNGLVGWLFKGAVAGQLNLTLPNGNHMVHRGDQSGPQASIVFHRWTAIGRYIVRGELAFVEDYLAGNISVPDLHPLFAWYLANEAALAKRQGNPISKMIERFVHLVVNDNNRKGSKNNISYHYDLGNDFYQLLLDDSMTYSSADFSRTQDLYQAQQDKYARMLDSVQLRCGDRLLEIGCGWGGMAEHALRRHDVAYRGITISEQQLAYAKSRLNRLECIDRADASDAICVFEDYRDTTGVYDAIVSVEMFEAVGEKHWDRFFDVCQKRLKPGGRACIQVITIRHDRFLTYRKNVDFIQKYIFPGGMLPSKRVFRQKAEQAGLSVTHEYAFGTDYAETLRRWRDQFDARWSDVENLGFDQRFYRMWHYYLAYCEIGFDAGAIDVVQFTLEKPDAEAAL